MSLSHGKWRILQVRASVSERWRKLAAMRVRLDATRLLRLYCDFVEAGRCCYSKHPTATKKNRDRCTVGVTLLRSGRGALSQTLSARSQSHHYPLSPESSESKQARIDAHSAKELAPMIVKEMFFFAVLSIGPAGSLLNHSKALPYSQTLPCMAVETARLVESFA